MYGLGPWLTWSEQLGLSLITRWLLVTLAWLESSTGSAFPSLRYLASKVGCSVSSIRTSLRELEELGVLRSVARFESRSFTGTRQISNRYEFLRWPTELACAPAAVTIVEATLEVANDDEKAPGALEVANDDDETPEQISLDEAMEAELSSVRCLASADLPDQAGLRPESKDGHFAQQPGQGVSRGELARAERPDAEAAHAEPPLGSTAAPVTTCPPPPQELVGIKNSEEKLKANSTRAREAEPAKASRPAVANPAAAFLCEVIPPERAQALKRRFGHEAFGSLLFVLRRKECAAEPRLSARVLGRLLEAPDVRNPGAWFSRVFAYEREAAQLAGAPTAEDQALEAERLEAQQLLARQRALEAQLERVRGCDLEAEERARAELEAVVRARRRVATKGGFDTPSAPSGPPEPKPSAAALPAEEQAAEAARILAMLRGRAA